MGFVVCIPARFGSTRLPGKPLADINGKTLIEHVYNRATESAAERVIIATDDLKIRDICDHFGAEVCMTARDHTSGTDRIAEAVSDIGLAADDIVVNLQGDEPLMPPQIIDQLATMMLESDNPDIGTAATPIRSLEEYHDHNVVKVVLGQGRDALYFSRSPIPWVRDSDTIPENAFRHLGLYAFRVSSLQYFVELPQAQLEIAESLEQLRALVNGMSIRVLVIEDPPPGGVDTETDLEKVRKILSK